MWLPSPQSCNFWILWLDLWLDLLTISSDVCKLTLQIYELKYYNISWVNEFASCTVKKVFFNVMTSKNIVFFPLDLKIFTWWMGICLQWGWHISEFSVKYACLLLSALKKLGHYTSQTVQLHLRWRWQNFMLRLLYYFLLELPFLNQLCRNGNRRPNFASADTVRVRLSCQIWLM
jgi:hypothetical protein